MEEERLAALSALVGVRVVGVERPPWGFENRTVLVTLADGRRVVAQQIANRALAPHKLRLGALLPDRFAAVGLRLPQQIAPDSQPDQPYAVREFIPGVSGATHLGSPGEAAGLARAMGALLPRLAQVPTAGLGLDDTWADPQRLAARASAWLDRAAALLDRLACTTLQELIANAPDWLEGSGPTFAHGDFCPVNVLLAEDARRPAISDQRPTPACERSEGTDPGLRRDEGDRGPTNQWCVSPVGVGDSPVLHVPVVVALLDVEWARIAHPLFDAAWWGWVVRYHHADRWPSAWPELMAAAGLPSDTTTMAQVHLIQRLRCLELLAEALPGNETAAQRWAERLQTTLTWAWSAGRESP
jgi:aminoglycoside phosphotransferase (APT) family kinase protein